MLHDEETGLAGSPSERRRELKSLLLLTGELRSRVLELIDAGAILPPESFVLKSKADGALHSLASGHPDQTAEWLSELVEIAQAMIRSGGDAADQGPPLIDQAQAVIRRLGG